MLNACLDKRLFPPAPIWSTILLLLSANAVAGAPLHANDDGTSSSSVMNGGMQTAPLLISTVLRKENADAVQCEPPAVSASKGHCMCPQGTACSGSEQCRGGVSVTTKQHVSGYLQNCAGCTCTALGKGGGGVVVTGKEHWLLHRRLPRFLRQRQHRPRQLRPAC